MAITLFNGENLNLLTLKKLITYNGVFDDFFDTTSTNANFTTNSAAGSGGTFSQKINSLILTSDGSTVTSRIKYQNNLAYTISKNGSWPTYINFVLETRLKFSNLVNLAGFSITHSDLNFTVASNKFWVGLFYDASGSGNSGLKIIDPSGVTTEYTTQVLSLDTEYNLVVEVYYNIELDSNNTLIHVFAWLDGVLIIDNFTIDRSNLNNYMLDGKIGLVGDIPISTAETIEWYYISCNRIVNIENVEYSKSMLYKIGEFNAKVFNTNNRLLRTITDQSPIHIYARNNLTLPDFVDFKRAISDPFANSDIDLETNLIHRLDLNGDSIDKTGNGFDGITMNGNASFTEKLARQVFSSPDLGSYLDLNDLTDDFSTGFSVSFWAYNTDFSGGTSTFFWFATHNSTKYNGLVFQLNPFGSKQEIHFFITNASASNILFMPITDATVRSGQWNHYVITYDTNNYCVIYLNGEAIGMAKGTSSIPIVTRTVCQLSQSTWRLHGFMHSFFMWDIAITHNQVIALYESGFIKYSPFANDLIIKLDLNGSVEDETTRYSGTLVGTANINYSLYGYRKVLDLDGNSDYLDLPEIDINWNKGFSLSFWCIFDLVSHADYEVIYTATSSAGSNNYRIILYRNTGTDDLIFRADDSVGTSLGTATASSVITAGNIMYVIVTIDSNGAITMYVNNSSAGTGTLSSMPASYPRQAHYIGWETSTYYMDGKIWDFCLWNRVLTSAEMTQLYENHWFKPQWDGYNRTNLTGDEDERKKTVGSNQFNYGIVQAYHYSRMLDKRFIIQSYSSKKTDFIITDSTVGIIPLSASDLVTTNNVGAGVVVLTKEYFQKSVREILLSLSAEEDFFVWIDEDHDLHFISSTDLVDSGKVYNSNDSNVTNYDFDYNLAENYTSVEVHGYGSTETGVHLVYKNPLSVQMDGGERTKIITDPSIKSNTEALRVAREFFLVNDGFLIGRIEITSDYDLEIGQIITINIEDDGYSIKNKKFIILEIKDDFSSDNMVLTLIEYGTNISDYLYELFLKNEKQGNIYLDSQASKTYAIQIDIVIGVKTTYLVEISTDGSTWSEYASGKAVTTNRAITILTSCLENNSPIGTSVIDGNFGNGLVFKIGSGTALPLITDTDLTDPISGENKTVLPSSIVQSTSKGNSISKATATWDNTSANDKTISEFGYYVDRQTNVLGSKSLNQYATISKWAPYNVATQLHAKCVIPPFRKTSSHYIRCTFTVQVETSPHIKGKV